MAHAAGIGMDLKIEIHLLPQPGEDRTSFLERVMASDYEIIRVEDDGRILVARSEEGN